MAEIRWEENLNRPTLRRAIRQQARSLTRPCRIVAENFLASDSRIDLLGVGDEGELVSLRIGCADDDDAKLLTRSLSDLAWLRERAEDLRKLVPDLGIEASSSPRAILFCPDFQLESRRAIEILPAGAVELIAYRCYRTHGQVEVVLDLPGILPSPGNAPTERTNPGSHESPSVPTSGSGFRTGLSDAQLHFDPIEATDID